MCQLFDYPNFTPVGSNFEVFHAGGWFDFGLIGSLAINKYSETHDIYEDRLKTTIAYYGYYYAFGYTMDLGAALTSGNFSLRGRFKHQSYVSIQGLDRFQDRIDKLVFRADDKDAEKVAAQVARAVAGDVIALQEALTGHTLDRERLVAGMVEAMEGDWDHKCMGRSAPARLARALKLAAERNVAVPKLQEIAAAHT